MHGFHGCYWRFDLSSGRGERIPIAESVLRTTLGGVGLGAWLLFRESPPGVDPLSPEAPLVFAFSPLVGTSLTTSAKFSVVAKSPLTGGISDALASSHFSIAGKASGVDAIVLIGACAEPSELVDGCLRPSKNWGRSAEETGKSLAEFGRVASIGVAGENLVRFATISADGRHAGRGGLGAVMGAKRLKAIAVCGEVDTPIARPEAVADWARRLRAGAAGEATAKYRELGTAGNLLSFDRLGLLPTRNFQTSHFEGAAGLAAEKMRPTRTHTRTSCASCTIGCEHRYGYAAAEDGSTKDSGETTRVEYESLFALGPLCEVADPDVVLAACRRCDDLGLDTISVGATLAFAMECGERGLLEGAPRFGDGPQLLAWLDEIAHRKGLGDRLAEGSKRLAESIGGHSIDFAPQVKGLELPGYEPRSAQAMALGFAVATRGADHNRSGAYEADLSDEVDRMRGDARSVERAIETEDRAVVLDSLILCKFLRGALVDFDADCAGILNAVTGLDLSESDLRRSAQSVINLRKLYNIREGWLPSDDTLPERFLSEPLPSGPAAGASLPRERLDEMIQGYNRARGWSDSGYPSESEAERLLADLGIALEDGLRSRLLALSSPLGIAEGRSS